MTIERQVQLSNTFNEFRVAYNDVASGLTNAEATIVGITTTGSSSVYANTVQVGNLNVGGGRVLISGAPGSGVGALIQDDSGLTFNPSTNVLTAAGGVTTATLNATGNTTLGSGANNAVYYASNGSLILTSSGDASGTGRLQSNHVHATWHVGSGGDLETWATAKGDNADTHKVFAVANTNAPIDMMVVNQNEGANAYAEFIAIHATGNTADGWVSMGVNSTNYADGAFGITKADDAYLLYSAPVGTSESGDLVIGTSGNGTGNKIIFSAAGFDDPANNTQMVITPGQNIHIEIDTQSSNTTTGALTVNGGIGLVGNLNIGGNVAITGTITLGGGGNTVSTSSLQVDNPMIFVGSNNAADTFDLGFVGEYTSSGTKYTGLVRDANDSGIYKLFNGISAEPANTVDFTGASYSTLQVGALKAVDTTASSSNTTGALIVSGGAGIAGAVNAGGAIKTTDTTASSSTTTGALVVAGGAGIAGAVNIGGALTVTGAATFTGGLRAQEIIEDLVDTTASGNAVTLDYTTGGVFYESGTYSANFTVNITNVPTDNGRATTITYMVPQGSTGYIPTTLNVNGSGVTIRWPAGTAPTPTSSSGKIDIFTFTIYRRGGSFFSLANATLNF